MSAGFMIQEGLVITAPEADSLLRVYASTCGRRDPGTCFHESLGAVTQLSGTTGLNLRVPAARCELPLPLCKDTSFTRGRAASIWQSMLAPQLRSLLVMVSVHRGTAQLTSTALAPTAGEAGL